MQVKRFVAADMRRALELVRQELGPDAIILSSNRIPDGVELLTTMGSDNELMQLQKQPLDKMALFSESPMMSDGAWSQNERHTKKHFEAPALHSVPAIAQAPQSKLGRSGQQLADEIEQARARMLASRKAEESAREFMVGKNTRVNAGIPRNSGAFKEESRHSGAVKQESRYAEPVKQESRFAPSNSNQQAHSVQQAKPAQVDTRYAGSVADRARSATSANPGRSDRDDVHYSGSIADRARSATTANPKANSLRSENYYRDENANAAAAAAAKEDSLRPQSSQVTIPPRRVPVPRPVLSEKKQQQPAPVKQQPVIKPKSQMTAAERYPLIDDEPEEIMTPRLMQQAVQKAVQEAMQQAVEQAVEQVVQRQAPVVIPVAPVVAETPAPIVSELPLPVSAVNTDVVVGAEKAVSNEAIENTAVNADVNGGDAGAVEAALAVATFNSQVVESQIANSKHLLDLQSELADMRSLLEQQFSSLREMNTVASIATITNTRANEVSETKPEEVISAAPVVESINEAVQVEDFLVEDVADAEVVTEELVPVTLSLDAKVEIDDIASVVGASDASVVNSVSAESSGAHAENSNEYLLELQTELADMRFLLEQQFNRLSEADAPMASSSILGGITRRLGRAGLPEDVVNKVISSCTKTNSMNEAWPEALANLSHQVPVIDRDIVDEGGIFAFVGPTGVGKTTTIGKLAARYVLKHGADKVALITTDTYRIASHEQLRSIARILRISVNVVDENNSLESLLKSLSHCSAVLIDTAGFRHGDPQLKAQLATLAALPQIKTFVVLSTTCQAQMLKASVHAHGEARLQGCVLTKLDETTSLGEALGVVIKGWLPVAYTTDGQDIPADIDVARAHSLVAKAIAMIKKNTVSAVS